jgi:hypothetical protein
MMWLEGWRSGYGMIPIPGQALMPCGFPRRKNDKYRFEKNLTGW